MPGKRSIEDILADYADKLVAGQPPDIAADFAGLTTDEQQELLRLLGVVHAINGAYRQIPDPRPEFVQRLDDFVAALGRQRVAAQPRRAEAPPVSADQVAPDESRPAPGLAYDTEFLTSPDFDELLKQAMHALEKQHRGLRHTRFVHAPAQRYHSYHGRFSTGHREMGIAFGLKYQVWDAPYLSAFAYCNTKIIPDGFERVNRVIEELDRNLAVPPGIERERPPETDHYFYAGIQLKMPAEDLCKLSRVRSKKEALDRLIRFFSRCIHVIEEGMQRME